MLRCRAGGAQRPDQDFQFACEVQHRVSIWKIYACRNPDRIDLDVGVGILQRPLGMMDFTAIDFAVMHGVKAVAFRGPVLE